MKSSSFGSVSVLSNYFAFGDIIGFTDPILNK